MRNFLLLFFVAASTAAWVEQDQSEVLARATGKVVSTNQRLPNYTCVQTVTRRYFRPLGNTLAKPCRAIMEARKHPTPDLVLRHSGTDRLRLDVAMVDGGEIFAWAGSSRFEDQEIGRVVRSGPVGTGIFGGLLKVVFQLDVKNFTYLGTQADSRVLFLYHFEVAKAASHYRVKIPDSWTVTAYQGSIQIDPESGDLVRISLETAELPPSVGLCISMIDMEVEMTDIGSSRFFLPVLARQRFVAPDGQEVENTIAFSNCREYTGQSKLILEEAPTKETRRPVRVPPPPVSLPPDSHFSMELTAPIVSDEAAAGDAFSAKLTEPLRDPQRKVLAPRGTVVMGHIVRLQSFITPPEVLVVLRPEVLELRGTQVPLNAVPDYLVSQVRARSSRDRRRLTFTLPLPGEEHTGVFRFSGEHAVVPKGFDTDWRTEGGKEPVKGPTRPPN